MVFSYSQIAAPSADTPKIISIASTAGSSSASKAVDSGIATDAPGPSAPSAATTGPDTSSPPASKPAPSSLATQPEAGPSRPPAPRLKHLILDAGPLLSLTPLRHLAETYHTTPAVLAELRDPKAREHWDRLALTGVDVKVEQPQPEAMARAMAFARKTGDYAVLSQTDLGVVALTLQYELRENGEVNVRKEPGEKKVRAEEGEKVQGGVAAEAAPQGSETAAQAQTVEGVDEAQDALADEEAESSGDESSESGDEAGADEADEQEASPPTDLAITETLDATHLDSASISNPERKSTPSSTKKVQTTNNEDDPESDGGEWITPSNLAQHRSKDLGLLPSTSPNAQQVTLAAAAMTGDFAVQNVLLSMGLGLVGEGGKRISKVKSWVLRCHACFKICRDPSKRFCPSCGGPTLMRTNVTTSANGKMHLHLKKNYQYNLRGTKFTIPDAKPGRAKGQIKAGTGLILREDQREWQDAVRLEEGRKRKEEKKAQKGGWEDPDWLPEILTVGMSGKGRSGGHNMPNIGHGRKNPNVARKKR